MFMHLHVKHTFSKSLLSEYFHSHKETSCQHEYQTRLSYFGDPNNSCCKSFPYSIMFSISFTTANQILSRYSKVMKDHFVLYSKSFLRGTFLYTPKQVYYTTFGCICQPQFAFFHIILIFAFLYHHAFTTISSSKNLCGFTVFVSVMS